MNRNSSPPDAADASVPQPRRCDAGSALLLLATLLLGAVGSELLLRAILDRPIFALVDFRASAMARTAMPAVRLHDRELEWTLRTGYDSPGFKTLDHGIRSNGFGETGLRLGHALAVGDSFTAGSEVIDPETWLAQLERLRRMPVLNAGVGGYGTD